MKHGVAGETTSETCIRTKKGLLSINLCVSGLMAMYGSLHHKLNVPTPYYVCIVPTMYV